MSNTKTTVTATDNTIDLATLSSVTGGALPTTRSSSVTDAVRGCGPGGCIPFPGGPKKPFPFPRPFPGPRNPLGDLFEGGSVGERIGRAVGGQ